MVYHKVLYWELHHSHYVWDAPQVVKCIVSMFADDIKLYTVLTDRNPNLKLINDLASMQTWFSRMQMTFNNEKCTVLLLGSNNPNHQYTMPMSGEAVHTLEVTIDGGNRVNYRQPAKILNACPESSSQAQHLSN